MGDRERKGSLNYGIQEISGPLGDSSGLMW